MQNINYKVTIGNWSVDSSADPNNELIELEIEQSLNSPVGSCRIMASTPSSSRAGPVGAGVSAAAGALGLGGPAAGGQAFQVRGQDIKHTDQITVALTAGEISDTVLTGVVQTVDSSFSNIVVYGRTGMQTLAQTHLNQVYENQSLGQIVNDLASQAGVNTGEVDMGNTYPYLVVHQSISVLQVMRELARRESMDIYFDTQDQLTIKKFTKSSGDHTFSFGVHILDVQILDHQMIPEQVKVYGESPASGQGMDTWYWIAKDISSFSGEAGQGSKSVALQDRAIRTKDSADLLASSVLGASTDESIRGKLTILGNPSVKLGDAIDIKDAPQSQLNGFYKVTSVRHELTKRDGYLTYIGFSGAGGSSSSGGALGGLGI